MAAVAGTGTDDPELLGVPVKHEYLLKRAKQRISTLPVWNNKGILVQRSKKKDGKSLEVPVMGPDPDVWPHWIIPGANPSFRKDSILEDWYLKNCKIAFWHPKLFWYVFFPGPNKLKCPDCGSAERVIGDGWSPRLRAVCELDGTLFIIDYRYRCVGCPKTTGQGKDRCFSSMHPTVVAGLLAFIQREFEEAFLLTHRAGLNRGLLHFVGALAVEGVGFSKSEKLIEESHARVFFSTEEQYYLYREAVERSERGSLGSFFGAASSSKAPAFGGFRAPDGYRVYLPSSGYLTTAYLAEFKRRERWLQQQLERVDGKYQRFDHTFKVAKQVRAADGSKAGLSLFTGMNSYGEITCQVSTQTTSIDEVVPVLEGLSLRPERFGFSPIEKVWVDNPQTSKHKISRPLKLDPSDILLDALHGMMVVARTVPDDHSMKGPLMTRMSEAVFDVVEGDKDLVVNYLRGQGLSNSEISAKPASYFKKHCRRFIPGPMVLAQRLRRVYETYRCSIDAATGAPLFNKATEKAFHNLIRYSEEGLLSDPFGVDQMYVQVGTWGNGIPKYAAIRGSSPLEGYHKHIARVLSGANNSAELGHALLLDKNHRWNTNARVAKRGQRDFSMYDFRYIEKTKRACQRLGMADPYPEYVIQDFEPRERFGFDVLPPGSELLAGASGPLPTELPVVEDDGGASFFEQDLEPRDQAPPIAPIRDRIPTAAPAPALSGGSFRPVVPSSTTYPNVEPEGVSARRSQLPTPLEGPGTAADVAAHGQPAQPASHISGSHGGSQGRIFSFPVLPSSHGARDQTPVFQQQGAYLPHQNPQSQGPLGGAPQFSSSGFGQPWLPHAHPVGLQSAHSRATLESTVGLSRFRGFPMGGEQRKKSGARRKRLVDLATSQFSPTEVEWFVRLQSKHRKGASTNWQAMLYDWNTSLIQLKLDPNKAALCEGVNPKLVGQLQGFEKKAYDAINQQASQLSRVALNPANAQRHPLTHYTASRFTTPVATSSPKAYAAGAHFYFSGHPSLAPVHNPVSQVVGVKRPLEVGPPNRGGKNTPKTCLKCSEASGQPVYRKEHICPYKAAQGPS